MVRVCLCPALATYVASFSDLCGARAGSVNDMPLPVGEALPLVHDRSLPLREVSK